MVLKNYTVKFVNPVSGKPVEGAILNVTFKENLDTDFDRQRKVTVTDSDSGSVIPYQSTDGEEAVAQIKTDKNGIATFHSYWYKRNGYSNRILRWKLPRMGYKRRYSS